MFSSFLKSIKSIAKGPRAVLAESIAAVLSEHFVLDPGDIESSLLKDSKIVLKNTQLRERKYRSDVVSNTVVTVKGVVEEVVFSWRWSLTRETSTSTTKGQYSYASAGGMVQDVILTIRGIKVRITLDAWDRMDEAEQVLVESLQSTSIDDDSEAIESIDSPSVVEKQGLMKKYVKQVVDHLVLKIEDFEFAIQVGNGSSIITSGQNLELGTLSSAKLTNNNEGSTTNRSILSQRISIASISISGRDNESGKTFVLIEQFGYAASVIRFSGERFRGGILSGLEVVGQPEAPNDSMNEVEGRADEGVVFHIGLPQIQALSAIGVMLVPSNSDGDDSSRCNDSPDGVTKQNDDGEEVQCTKFNLPLPRLTIVLTPVKANKVSTRISLPRASVLYTADGKVFQMEGQEGIEDNETPLVELAAGGKWSFDFVKKTFNLNKDGGGCKIKISDEALTRISSGIASLSSSDDIANLKDALENTKNLSPDNPQGTSSELWSISTGCITLHMTGGDKEWMEANIAHSSAKLSPKMDKFTEIGIGKCVVSSSFNNAAAITVPECRFFSGAFRVPNTVEVTVGSIEDAHQIRDFMLSFLQQPSQPSSGKQSLPCAVVLDRVKLVVKEFYIDMQNLSAEGNTISCKELIFHEASGIAALLKGIESNFDSDLQMKIDLISSFVIPGVIEFDAPVSNTSIRYSNNGILIEMLTPIHASMLSSTTSTVPVQKDPSTQRNDITIPVDINLRAAFVNLKMKSARDEACIQMAHTAMIVSPNVVPQLDLSGKKGAKISLQMGSIKHHLFQAQDIRSSFRVDFQDLECLHQLKASIRSPQISAGFSTIDWYSLFNETESNDISQQKRLKLPFAKVASTSISVLYEGAIIGSEATIALPEFCGKSGTTSDDLSAHYTNIICKRIPEFFTNIDVLGNNVVDTTFSSVGRAALGASSVTKAGVGSIVGTAVADGVRGAISAGKASRDVATDDKYKFGDFSRGVVRGIGQATKRGAQSRGSDGSDYIPGDFTVGAVGGLADYGEKNSTKLASAGASGMGSTIGLAVAGPLGFVVGGYLGGKIVSDGKGEQQTKQQQYQQQGPDADRLQGVQSKYIGGQNVQQQHSQSRKHQQPQAQYYNTHQRQIQQHVAVSRQNMQQQQQQQQHPQSIQYQQPQAQYNPHQRQIQQHVVASGQNAQQQQHPRSRQYQQPQAQYDPHQRQIQQHVAVSRQNVQQQQQQQHPQSRQYQQPQAQHNPHQRQIQQHAVASGQNMQQIQHPRSIQYQQPQAQHSPHQRQIQQHVAQPRHPQQQVENKPYQFGDLTRGIVGRGKQADGRSKESGYKFGDFTRGLFR